MGIFTGMDISASALTAQRLRLDVISSNISNSSSTRGRYVNGQWEPYRRKMVMMEEKSGASFAQVLSGIRDGNVSANRGVRVSRIAEDPTPFKRVYKPEHPDADAEGYVSYPNVDMTKEMTDLVVAMRAYEANVTALNATKAMNMKALEIGRR